MKKPFMDRKGLHHEFLLLSCLEYEKAGGFRGIINDPRAVHIHEDILWYLNDTLKWFPTRNPATSETYNPLHMEKFVGLAMYGPTIIYSDGSPVMASIFQVWATLFAIGPERFTLTGDWEVYPDQPADEGYYAAIEIHRDNLVTRLQLLSSYAQQVVDSDGKLLILHQGV
jgi:hypothetical protein